jgi:hypothetical protein
VRPAQEARQPQSSEARPVSPPEAHVLTDRRFQTLEEYQAAGTAQGTEHANGANRTGTHPYPELPQQRPSDPARPAAQGEHPDQAALTRIHWDFQGTSSDIYSNGTRSAYLSSPSDMTHLGPLGSEGAQPTKGEPAALPHDAGRYLSTGERQVGIPYVGEKPDKSPSDTSDLPPSGKELAEGAEDDKLSRFERVRRAAEDQEILRDVPDAITEQGNAWQHALAKMPPEGHSVQVVHDHPHHAETTADHATVGDIASTGVMLGIVLFEGGRWLAGHLGHRKEKVT